MKFLKHQKLLIIDDLYFFYLISLACINIRYNNKWMVFTWSLINYYFLTSIPFILFLFITPLTLDGIRFEFLACWFFISWQFSYNAKPPISIPRLNVFLHRIFTLIPCMSFRAVRSFWFEIRGLVICFISYSLTKTSKQIWAVIYWKKSWSLSTYSIYD